MPLKKLNVKGFSHDLLVVVIVVVFSITGVAYLVAGRADNCGAAVSSADSGAVSTSTSGATSSTPCVPASSPVTAPVSQPTTAALAGSCVLSGLPANPAYGQHINPTVTYTNSGTQAFMPNGNASMETLGDNGGQGVKGGPVNAASLAPGQNATVNTGLQYTVGYSAPSARSVMFTVLNANPGFSCSGKITLPTSPTAPKVATSTASCVITGVPQKPRAGQTLDPLLAITNTGTATLGIHPASSLNLFSAQGKESTSRQKTFNIASLKPGAKYYAHLASYRVPHRSNSVVRGTFNGSDSSPAFKCSASFTLPS